MNIRDTVAAWIATRDLRARILEEEPIMKRLDNFIKAVEANNALLAGLTQELQDTRYNIDANLREHAMALANKTGMR